MNYIFDSYLPNTPKAIMTGLYTHLGNQDVDFNTLYAKNSNGTQILSKYRISTGADVSTIFNPCTVDVLVNNPVTNTLPCAVLCAYGGGQWGTTWAITVSPNPFNTTSWTNYWIYTTSNDINNANGYQYSFQKSYVSYSTTSLLASLVVMVDNYLNYIYLNNISITTYRQYGSSAIGTINITLLPGTNLIDFYCQNVNGPASLIFYVKKNTTGELLCQSDASLMYRQV